MSNQQPTSIIELGVAALGNAPSQGTLNQQQPGVADGRESQAESAKKAEEGQLAGSSNILSNPQLTRSYLLPNNDRYILEQEILEPLRAGSGLFGTGLIDLEDLKRQKCRIHGEQKIQKNKEMLDRLRQDGIYVDDPDVIQKFTDINTQKLEERLLKNGQTEFFKMNGELKLDNDIIDDTLTRPADLAFEQTTVFQTMEINAILSDRLHSFKKRYYRLDIILGNLKLFNCKSLLSNEEKLAIQLKEQFQDYETRISLGMIPFYMDRIDFISKEIEAKQARRNRGESILQADLDFLLKTRDEVENSLQKEKFEVNRMANGLYDLWTQILAEREHQKFLSTNVELKVHKQQMDDGCVDELLDLKYDNSITPEKELPSAERSRQSKLRRLQVYAVLLINERKVSKTNKVAMNWPNFNFQLMEMFQVHVFTIPSSIRVELMLVDGFSETSIDVVSVEVPGAHVKSLTCSCPLVQKIPFSKLEFEQSKVAKKYIAQSGKPDGVLTEAQKAKMLIEQEKKAKEEQLRKDQDILGEVFIKAEWKGNGPKMPPIRSENLFKKPLLHKNRKQYTQEEELKMLLRQLYIDVNDPRNQMIIKILRETKNEFLVGLLDADSKNLMAETTPFRHKLLEARAKDPAGFRKVFIPLLDQELIDSSRSSYYLKQLEQLYRNEAYQIHLQKIIAKQKESEEEGKADQMSDLFNVWDLEALKRRQIIFDQIKERQQREANKTTKSSSTYRSVVHEEEFSYDTNFLVSISEKLFMRGRKLKPLVKVKPAVNFEGQTECKIIVHVIKAENVPIRKDLFEQYNALRAQEGQGKPQLGRSHRPTASLPPNKTGDPNYEREEGLEDDRANRQIKTESQLNMMPQVETYVEIKIQYHEKYAILKTTQVDEGTMPRWNEIFDFPFEASSSEGFTLKELSSSKTLIIATLFDRQTYQSFREGERVIQEEHRYLGSVQIPLLTLLTNAGKTDFNFKLDRPIVLPNYRVLDQEIYYMSKEDLVKYRAMEHEQVPTYLNISISLEPNIELPSENTEYCYPGAEDQKLLDDGSKWLHDLRTKCKFKNSHIKLFGESLNGTSVLLCRFLTPQKPPEDVVGNVVNDLYAIERVARFVSMIPYVEDLGFFGAEMPDLFSTSQEFLDLGGGDYEEHAILLCNYFAYIDRELKKPYQSYIVLGNGMPAGKMTFVMRKESVENGSVELWDPSTGYCYFYENKAPSRAMCSFLKRTNYLEIRPTDPMCPITQIHTVISSSNVYVNMQKSDYPVLIDFDLTNKSKWKAFFAKETVHQTIQPMGGALLYSKPQLAENSQVFENRIQKYLVEMFQEERIKRVRKTTKWAVSANDKLYEILTDCEEWSAMARHGGILSSMMPSQRQVNQQGQQNQPLGQGENINLMRISSFLDQLGQDYNNKRVWGFPLNTTFTSLENLWKLVQTTKMHAVPRQDVEFGLAVYIKAYPANMLSVWVYLAAFVDITIENLYQ